VSGESTAHGATRAIGSLRKRFGIIPSDGGDCNMADCRVCVAGAVVRGSRTRAGGVPLPACGEIEPGRYDSAV
jgi:hypothetical protein